MNNNRNMKTTSNITKTAGAIIEKTTKTTTISITRNTISIIIIIPTGTRIKEGTTKW